MFILLNLLNLTQDHLILFLDLIEFFVDLLVVLVFQVILSFAFIQFFLCELQFLFYQCLKLHVLIALLEAFLLSHLELRFQSSDPRLKPTHQRVELMLGLFCFFLKFELLPFLLTLETLESLRE